MKKEAARQSEKPNGALMSHWFEMTQLFSRATLPLLFILLGTLKKPHSHFFPGHNSHNIHPSTQKKIKQRHADYIRIRHAFQTITHEHFFFYL